MEPFFWEIDAALKRKRILFFWLAASLLTFGLPFSVQSTWSDGMGPMLNAMILLLLLESLYFGVRYIFVGSVKAYTLSPEGVLIKSGRTSHQYKWSEFSCFMRCSERLQKSIDEGFRHGGMSAQAAPYEEMAKKTLEDVYLRFSKAPFGVGKKFLVLDVKSDDISQVMALLGTHLPREKMTHTTDLGLVFYRRS